MNVALSMAGDMKAKLFVLAVIRPPEPAESAEFHAVLDEGRERFEKSFIPIRERAKEREIELETDVVVDSSQSRHHSGQPHCPGQAQPHHSSSLDARLQFGAGSQVRALSSDDCALI